MQVIDGDSHFREGSKKVLTIYPYYPFTLYPISLGPITRIWGGVLIGEERYVS